MISLIELLLILNIAVNVTTSPIATDQVKLLLLYSSPTHVTVNSNLFLCQQIQFFDATHQLSLRSLNFLRLISHSIPNSVIFLNSHPFIILMLSTLQFIYQVQLLLDLFIVKHQDWKINAPKLILIHHYITKLFIPFITAVYILYWFKLSKIGFFTLFYFS